MRRRRLLPVLGLTALVLLLPAALAAQRPALRIARGDSIIAFTAASHHGYTAYPATALAGLGAVLEATPRGLRARLGQDTLTFELLSPVFYDGGRPRQLFGPVYRQADTIFLPGQLFTDWLPASRPVLLSYQGDTLRLVSEPRSNPGADEPGARARVGSAPPSVSPGQPAQGTLPRAQAGDPAQKSASRVVIIDPGHGGVDPGKIGPGGIREKDLTLAISQRLATVLRERGGFEVHLTRTTDTLIALAERPQLANRWKGNRPAALFISIHANSASNKNAHGFETFFLSAARTEDERRVAEMENAAVAYETTSDTTALDDLDWIFNTLRNDFYVRASNDLAELIQRHLGTIHPGPDRGVKQAGFRVLVGAFMPAVLVETAFISHAREAALLKEASFQQKVATALATAIEDFFTSHEHLWATEGGQTTARGGR